MTADRIPLTDPRVVALARARQQLAHEGVFVPVWDELTPAEQEESLPDARSYPMAAIRAGLVGPSRAEMLREAAGRLDAVPLGCTALTGPVWYGQGWKDAVHHLRDLADTSLETLARVDAIAAVSGPRGTTTSGPDATPIPDDIRAEIYEALVTFQATAQWPTLRHAQLRQYLAEHIAQALTADAAEEEPFPAAPRAAGLPPENVRLAAPEKD